MSNFKRSARVITPERTNGREQKIAPGLWVNRRSFIACCSAGIATNAFVAAASAMADDAPESFEAFLESANAIAERMLEDRSADGQDRYLRTIAAKAAGLRDVPVPTEWRPSGEDENAGTYIGFNPGGIKFGVLHWRMEPNTRIVPHAHNYGNVVTVGLEGLVRVRNYEAVGTPDYLSDADFIVRNTVDQLLKPGSSNLVSLQRDYVHGFDATAEGGRGLDITTRVQPKSDFGTAYLAIKEPFDDAGMNRHFVARWRRV